MSLENFDDHKIDSLLKKVSALANGGIDGEKSVAQAKLNQIGIKYGVDVKDLVVNVDLITREFTVANTDDAMQIMAHCIWDVSPDTQIRNSKRKVYCVIGLENYLIIKENYNKHWKAYKKKKNELLVSYIIENQIGMIKNT